MTFKSEINAREEKLLEFLWEKAAPMTSTEMIEELEPQGWKQITLLKVIQSLTEKGYLDVVGVVRAGKTYSRKLKPSITKGEYYSRMLKEKGVGEADFIDISVALLGTDGSTSISTEKIIDKLENVISVLRSSQEK